MLLYFYTIGFLAASELRWDPAREALSAIAALLSARRSGREDPLCMPQVELSAQVILILNSSEDTIG